MKIVFMGTPDFSVGPLEALLRAGHEITAVVTQPDKPKGRGKEIQYSPVKECALRHNLPVFQPVKIKLPEAVAQLETYEADIYIVVAFGQILSKDILTMPKYGCLNIHASLLPKYRGAAPIQQAIIDGETKTGITIQQMAEGIDNGDILYKKEIMIAPKETGASLFDKLSLLGAEAIVEALSLLQEGRLVPQKQDESLATYVGRREKTEGLIDWQTSAVCIERLIRGLNSWPSAYTIWKGKQLKIWEADVAEMSDKTLQETIANNKKDSMPPGCIYCVSREAVYVQTGDGILSIKEWQLEGKKRMTVHDFLLGYQLMAGEQLGK